MTNEEVKNDIKKMINELDFNNDELCLISSFIFLYYVKDLDLIEDELIKAIKESKYNERNKI